MIAYVIIDMKAIIKLRENPDEKIAKDALPDTLDALKAIGFKKKKHQGNIFERWKMIRGELKENKIAAIRKIPFIFKAHFAGEGKCPKDRK